MMNLMMKSIIVIYINYAASISIIKQTSLTSINTDKLNLRLVWVSQYLSQFNLNIQYKMKKINIIFNILFWLSRKKQKINTEEFLKKMYVLMIIFLKIILNFNRELLTINQKNKTLMSIQNLIFNEIFFYFKDNQLYYIEKQHDQLCILRKLKQRIFQIIYNDQLYIEYHWIYF